jgi:carboxymethylenebutenolidase
MRLQHDWTEFQSSQGPVPAWLSCPAAVSDPLPGVVVIQEVWGVDGHIQDVADRFASAGYVALAPDLHSAGGARPPALAPERVEAVKAFLDTLRPGEWMAILGDEGRRAEILARLPGDQGAALGETLGTLFSGARDASAQVGVLQAAVGFLKGHEACAGRPVGAVGYCMGGSLSALLACAEPELAAAVVYYGSSPPAERVEAIRCPILGLYGEQDERITSGVPAFAEAMKAAGKRFEYQIYPETPHAFFNDTRASYRVEAARDAWARTLAFFAEQLVLRE